MHGIRSRQPVAALLVGGCAALLLGVALLRPGGDTADRPTDPIAPVTVMRGGAAEPVVPPAAVANVPTTVLPVAAIANSIAREDSGDENIGIRIVRPGPDLVRLGLRDGDVLTYIDEDGMNRGQTPEEVRTALLSGSRLSVLRDGSEQSIPIRR